jgi:hypothetical protein
LTSKYILISRPSVHVASRDSSHPFISSHPTSESVAAILQDEVSGDIKGKGRQGEEPRVVLQHALRWAVERSDIGLITWLCGLDGKWVSSIASKDCREC